MQVRAKRKDADDGTRPADDTDPRHGLLERLRTLRPTAGGLKEHRLQF